MTSVIHNLSYKSANTPANQWITIVNPNAGTKKGEKDWYTISRLLKDHQIRCTEFFTKRKEHAISIVLDTIKKGHRKFIVVGGDGTLNEVVNGIFLQEDIPSHEFVVGMIPVGTGNDWCRMFKVPFNYKKAVKLIDKQNTFIQDIGKVSYLNMDDRKTRYFINVAGMGYDAVVAAKTNKDKSLGRGGPLVYLKNLFTSLLFYKHTDTNIYLDHAEKPISNRTFSLSVGICKYNGGGMMQLPYAVADDGIFDITLMKKLNKFTVLKEVKNLYDGSFVKHPKVETFRGKNIRITSDPDIHIEVDGESLGHSPFEFEMIPRSLRVITGKLKNKLV